MFENLVMSGNDFRRRFDEGDPLCILAEYKARRSGMVSNLWNAKPHFRLKYLEKAEDFINRIEKFNLKLVYEKT